MKYRLEVQFANSALFYDLGWLNETQAKQLLAWWQKPDIALYTNTTQGNFVVLNRSLINTIRLVQLT